MFFAFYWEKMLWVYFYWELRNWWLFPNSSGKKLHIWKPYTYSTQSLCLVLKMEEITAVLHTRQYIEYLYITNFVALLESSIALLNLWDYIRISLSCYWFCGIIRHLYQWYCGIWYQPLSLSFCLWH